MGNATALAPVDMAGAIEKVLISGDLAPLTPEQRVRYYYSVCDSLNINPLTKPFAYIELNGALTLYALKDCTDQLRKRDNISIAIVAREIHDDVYVVTARATAPDGRVDEATGAVPLIREDGTWEEARSGKRFFKGNGRYIPLKPDDRANAMMKAETKARRRATLAICGLGMTDESELETIPNARRVPMDDAPVARVVAEKRAALKPDREALIAEIERLLDYPEAPEAWLTVDLDTLSDDQLAEALTEIGAFIRAGNDEVFDDE